MADKHDSDGGKWLVISFYAGTVSSSTFVRTEEIAKREAARLCGERRDALVARVTARVTPLPLQLAWQLEAQA